MGGIQSTARESAIESPCMGFWKDSVGISSNFDGVARYSISDISCCNVGDYSYLFCPHALA
jgi:hypothetical protein